MEIKAVIHLLGWLVTLSLLSSSGQNLIDQSTSISQVLYSLNWYEYDAELNFYIRMMMLRSQKPLGVKAGIFYVYSFEFLLTILQASYTYMTILTQIDNSHWN
ncbi:hypothetical protein MTP99_004069 [Tenebrio molitor]|nr:hypothetical protein MTP99_004069 [Tenebrio molitor]